jgi:hypothetical protein
LASVFHVLGFTEEALMVDKYGKSELVGGTVDAIRKVGQFAQSKLPEWITRKVLKKAHLFNWEVLLQEQMQGTILLGVLNESDGNASHAVAIHGGYVYDANEAVAIPLCKESCSTSRVKNEFVSFRKATLFFFEGKDEEKKRQMTVPMKQKRENSDYL